MDCTCQRCDRSWISRAGKPKNCRWCKSPYWDKPIERASVSEASRSRTALPPEVHGDEDRYPGTESIEDEEPVTSGHPIPVLELAAQAEAPIGRSVTDFLLKNPPRVAVDAILPEEEAPEVEDWQKRCREDFGKAITERVGREWKKLTWEQRHAKLKEQRDGTSADGW